VGVKLGRSCYTDSVSGKVDEENMWIKEGVSSRRRLRNEELYNLYASPNIRNIRWVVLVARMGDMKNF
jgi:hypothetical protein